MFRERLTSAGCMAHVCMPPPRRRMRAWQSAVLVYGRGSLRAIASAPKWRTATAQGAQRARHGGSGTPAARHARAAPTSPPCIPIPLSNQLQSSRSLQVLTPAAAAACRRLPCWGCREGEELVPAELDPKVVEVYQGVGKVLSRYTAGKVRLLPWGSRPFSRALRAWPCLFPLPPRAYAALHGALPRPPRPRG